MRVPRRLLLMPVLLSASALAQGYVNPKVCAGCHAAIAKTYRQNGMGRSFSAPKPEILIEDFTKNNTYYHAASGTHYRDVDARATAFFSVNTSSTSTASRPTCRRRRSILSSGPAITRALICTAPWGNTLMRLPLAWYAEKGGYWAMNPGLIPPVILRPRRIGCDACSATTRIRRFRPATRPATCRFKRCLPEGIDCQRVIARRTARSGRRNSRRAARNVRAAIVNPRA